MKAPPRWKISKMYTSDVILSKTTETEIEDEFGQTEESLETYKIKAEIQTIRLEDVTFLPAGSIKEGDAWGFFLPSYTIDGESVTVEVNDYITFKSVVYLVQRIEDYYQGNTTVYRRALMRRQIGQ